MELIVLERIPFSEPVVVLDTGGLVQKALGIGG
jgi:hypothetical protein